MDIEFTFWFYALSAIPQTLAAIITLTATFIVFKLNAIDSNINTDIYHAKIFLPSIDNDFNPYIRKNNVKEVIVSLEEAIAKIDPGKPFLGLHPTNFSHLAEDCKDIIGHGLKAFPLNAVNIYKFINYKYDSLVGSNDSKIRIIRYLKDCLILTAVPIVFSLLFLPLQTSLNELSFSLVISILVGFSGASTMYISYVIYTISKLKN